MLHLMFLPSEKNAAQADLFRPYSGILCGTLETVACMAIHEDASLVASAAVMGETSIWIASSEMPSLIMQQNALDADWCLMGLCSHFCCHIDGIDNHSAECSVLLLLAEGPVDPSKPGGDELYAFFRQAVDWCARLPEGHSFKVEARAWACSNIPTSLLMQARHSTCCVVSLTADGRFAFVACISLDRFPCSLSDAAEQP